MKKFITIAMLLLAVCASRSATIIDTITDAQGIGYAAKINFFPLSNPQTSGGTTLTSRQINVTCATNGTFSQVLQRGDYRVVIDGRNILLISVPNDGGTYNLAQVTTSNPLYVYPEVPATSALLSGLQDTLNLSLATNGQTIVYDSTTRKWIPGVGAGSVSGNALDPAMLRTNASGQITAVTNRTLPYRINVKDAPWNATGLGGTNDDYAACQAAAYYAASLTRPILLYFPSGIFNQSQTINITNDNVTVVGDGAQASIIKGTVSGMGRVLYFNNPSKRVFNFRVHGVGVQASNGLASPPDGIVFQNASQATIDFCQLGSGLNHVAVNDGCEIFTMLSCLGTTSADGIYLTHQDPSGFGDVNLFANDVHLYQTTNSGIHADGGFKMAIVANSSIEATTQGVLLENRSGTDAEFDHAIFENTWFQTLPGDGFTNSVFLRAKASAGGNYFITDFLTLKNVTAICNGSSNAVEFLTAGNTNAGTHFFNTSIANSTFNGMTNFGIYSDSANLDGQFSGTVQAKGTAQLYNSSANADWYPRLYAPALKMQDTNGVFRGFITRTSGNDIQYFSFDTNSALGWFIFDTTKNYYWGNGATGGNIMTLGVGTGLLSLNGGIIATNFVRANSANLTNGFTFQNGASAGGFLKSINANGDANWTTDGGTLTNVPGRFKSWTNMASGLQIDYAIALTNNFYRLLSGNVAFATVNEADNVTFQLKTEQDSTGSRIVTFPANWLWPQATNGPSTTPPGWSTNAGAVVIYKVDRINGTNYANIISDRDSVPQTDFNNGTMTSAEFLGQITDEAGSGPILAVSANGIVARTSASATAARTITGTANEITLSNGDGVSGNPTVSIPSAVTFTGKTVTGGTFSGATLTGNTTNSSATASTFAGYDGSKVLGSASLASSALRTALSDEVGTGPAMFTRTGVVRSFDLPMGAWLTNGIQSPATPASWTNSSDSLQFVDGSTNTARIKFALPLNWDGGAVRAQLVIGSTTTNSTTSTNAVFGLKLASIGNGEFEDALTFGTQVTVTNHVHRSPYKTVWCNTSDITPGNTPAANKPMVLELTRLTSDTTDVNTNTLSLVSFQLFYTETATEASMPAATN